MQHIVPVRTYSDIASEWQGTPIGDLLSYHNLGSAPRTYDKASVLVGMCMDHRERLRIPENFAYILRAGGANLRYSEFQVSYAIAIGGASAIALIGHTNCGMVNLMSRRSQFIDGLVRQAGWEREWAEPHFMHYLPIFEIGHEVDFLLSEAHRLQQRYPKIPVAPLLYRVEDKLLYQLKDAKVPVASNGAAV